MKSTFVPTFPIFFKNAIALLSPFLFVVVVVVEEDEGFTSSLAALASVDDEIILDDAEVLAVGITNATTPK